jgi:hypothetical protein
MAVHQNSPGAAPATLVAPCGMYCAVCSRYLAQRNGLRRSRCPGCRLRNEPCAYLFGRCTGRNHAAKTGAAAFCFTCDQYPCRVLRQVDRRYRENFGMSFLENLESIRAKGLPAFLAEQSRRHACPRCGELRSVHNGKCFRCEPVTRLIEKLPQRTGKAGSSPSPRARPAAALPKASRKE